MAGRPNTEQEPLAEVGAALGGFDAPPVPLDGGITNRNFRVALRGEDCVVRLPGKDTGLLGIDRVAERLATEAAAAVGPVVAAFLPGPGVLVTRFIPGRAVTPAELRDRVDEVAAALRAVHAGPALPARFDPFALVGDYAATARARG